MQSNFQQKENYFLELCLNFFQVICIRQPSLIGILYRSTGNVQQ